jgi:hypothetical protein
VAEILERRLQQLSKRAPGESVKGNVIHRITVQASIVIVHMSFEQRRYDRDIFMDHSPPEGSNFWWHLPEHPPHQVFFTKRRAGKLVRMLVKDLSSRRNASIGRADLVYVVVFFPNPKVIYCPAKRILCTTNTSGIIKLSSSFCIFQALPSIDNISLTFVAGAPTFLQMGLPPEESGMHLSDQMLVVEPSPVRLIRPRSSTYLPFRIAHQVCKQFFFPCSFHKLAIMEIFAF